MAYSEKETFLPLEQKHYIILSICKYTFFDCNVVQLYGMGLVELSMSLNWNVRDNRFNRRLLTAYKAERCDDLNYVKYAGRL
jgi:hypothetical protein